MANVTTASNRLTALDRLLIGYTALLALFIAVRFAHVRRPVELLLAHAAILACIVMLPARGAAWESRGADESLAWTATRQALRFLRYMYPLGLVIFYFEEVRYFVNALWPDNPYWFEPSLFAADRAIFGGSPGVLLNPFWGMPQDEIMHFFYFSYYLVVLGGGSFAYIGYPFTRKPPAAGFETAITSMTAAFLCAFVWYPYLPARGPWGERRADAGADRFPSLVFTPWIETIIAHGAVSGACFPSGHVAGTFGMSFGLLPHHPQRGAGLPVPGDGHVGGLPLHALSSRPRHCGRIAVRDGGILVRAARQLIASAGVPLKAFSRVGVWDFRFRRSSNRIE